VERVDLRGSGGSSLADSGECPTGSGGEPESRGGAVLCCDGEPSTQRAGSLSSEDESGPSLEMSSAACSNKCCPAASSGGHSAKCLKAIDVSRPSGYLMFAYAGFTSSSCTSSTNGEFLLERLKRRRNTFLGVNHDGREGPQAARRGNENMHSRRVQFVAVDNNDLMECKASINTLSQCVTGKPRVFRASFTVLHMMPLNRST